MKTYTLLINGQDLDTGKYEYFPYADRSISDYIETQRVIRELRAGHKPPGWDDCIYARYCINAEDTNRRALEAAHQASLKFKQFPLSIKRKIYVDMHRLLLSNREEFIQLMITEGHPRRLAEWEFEGMEIGSRPDTIDFYKKQLRKEIGRSDNEILYWARKPDGVVCLSPPGNASASNSYTAILVFLVGNTLVIKPPLRAPLATIFLWKQVVHEALKQNNAPPGTLNIVLGNSQLIMDEWINSPYVNDIAFFGDSRNGLKIAVNAFQRGKKPILELSGNDMLLLWKDGDLDQAAKSILDCFLGSGQICMVPKIGLIHEEVYDDFAGRVARATRELKVGLPSNGETVLSPVARMQECKEFLEDARLNGAEILCGGERVNYLDQPDQKGTYIKPSVLAIKNGFASQSMRCLREEIFFPLLPLVKISGTDRQIFQKMVTAVNSNEYGLRTSLWVQSSFYMRRFAKYLDNSGLLRINSRHVGFSPYLATHGGPGKTGGPFGEMNYMWQKTSHLQGICRTHIKGKAVGVR